LAGKQAKSMQPAINKEAINCTEHNRHEKRTLKNLSQTPQILLNTPKY
jgi:hypothetical protein